MQALLSTVSLACSLSVILFSRHQGTMVRGRPLWEVACCVGAFVFAVPAIILMFGG